MTASDGAVISITSIYATYFAAPILHILAWHVGQTPSWVGLPFFIVTGPTSLASRFSLHRLWVKF